MCVAGCNMSAIFWGCFEVLIRHIFYLEKFIYEGYGNRMPGYTKLTILLPKIISGTGMSSTKQIGLGGGVGGLMGTGSKNSSTKHAHQKNMG